MKITIFLCGDVMIGRGIDQILPYSSSPKLCEPYIKDAREYFTLAEITSGPIPHKVDFKYIWGEALWHLEKIKPDFRIINLETTFTLSESFLPGKEVHYRTHPKNINCLKEAKIDCVNLANNHALDFGRQGLIETLDTLEGAGIKTAGAGKNLDQAIKPATLNTKKGRILIFGCGHFTSGIPPDWQASKTLPGINFLPDFSQSSFSKLKKEIAHYKGKGDIAILSIHWGSNWGYDIGKKERDFAHKLIDEAGVDVIHGHSSHHIKGIELYKGKIIFYGCGDFINDYEGISGYESFRDDLTLMYFLRLQEDGFLESLEMVPMQIKRFKLQSPSLKDIKWLYETLKRESEKLETKIEIGFDNHFWLKG